MKLPLLLAGPIIRRSTTSSISLWLATSRSADLRATAHYRSADGSVEEAGDAANGVEEFCAGDSLYLYLVTLSPRTGSFRQDEIIYYNLLLDGKEITHPDLAGDAILYPGSSHPSLVIPSGLKRILHGSCRKPHGRSGDMLASADALLRESHQEASHRPELLMLTGDQIYADDVAGPLAACLSSLGASLTGWSEKMPTPPIPVDPATVPIYNRDRVLSLKYWGITSDEAGNHLLTFGEFAAMYLIVLSEALWDLCDFFGTPSNVAGALSNDKTYVEEFKALVNFRTTLPMVRRVLANIPVYMIFDDHDVTDDWNLDGEWKAKIEVNPPGRRMVSNALAAYWLFQGWGNDPSNFDGSFKESLRNHLEAKTHDGAKAERFDETLHEFASWDYYLPTEPPLLVVDSRTRRGYDKLSAPPKLMNREALEHLKKMWEKAAGPEPERKNPILVTATPVFGFEPFQNLQKFLVAGLGADPYKWDHETWIASRDGYYDLLYTLAHEMDLDSCTILSGDVHYAFTNRGTFCSKGKVFRGLQLTSSAQKNSPKNGKFLEWVASLTAHAESRMGWEPSAPFWYRLLRPLLAVKVRYGDPSSLKPGKYYWCDVVEAIRPDNHDRIIFSENNLGLVEIGEKGRVVHTLLNGNPVSPSRVVYRP